MNKGGFPKLWSIVFRSFYYARTSFRNQSYSPLFKIGQTSGRSIRFGKPLIAAVPVIFALNPFSKKDEKTSAETAEIIIKADALYDDTNYEELLKLLDPLKESNDSEILWRLARVLYRKSKTLSKDKEKLELLEPALAYVDKALESNESSAGAHKWKAILTNSVWVLKSIKGRLIHSYEMKTHIMRAIELNPTDATAYYILGEWCYAFADLPWYQRKTASILFATPPTSTFEEANIYFQKAEEVSPGFYSMNWLMLAKCALKFNDKEKALQYLRKIEGHPVKTQDDKQAHEEAAKILKSLS